MPPYPITLSILHTPIPFTPVSIIYLSIHLFISLTSSYLKKELKIVIKSKTSNRWYFCISATGTFSSVTRISNTFFLYICRFSFLLLFFSFLWGFAIGIWCSVLMYRCIAVSLCRCVAVSLCRCVAVSLCRCILCVLCSLCVFVSLFLCFLCLPVPSQTPTRMSERMVLFCFWSGR